MHNRFTTTHHAIVRNTSGVELQQVATPTIGPGELLLAPLVVGLCGTDIQILRGQRNEQAAIIGHEGIAKIIQAGSGCPPHLVPGTHVLVNPTSPYDPDFLLGHNIDGLFQEYVRIPASAVAAGLVFPVPATFPLELAALIEPLASVIYAFQLLKPLKQGKVMIIYGDGVIGHLALILARIRFGSVLSIIFVHHHQEGIAWSCAQQIQGDLDLLFTDLASGNAAMPAPNSALLATPRISTLDCLSHAVKSIAPNGCIDLLGGLPDNAHLPNLPDIDLTKLRAANCGGIPHQGMFAQTITADNKPLLLCGHRGVSNDHLLQAVTELTTHSDIYSKLISHQLDLKDAAAFMQHLFQQGSRQINDQRVMKLGVHIHDNYLQLRRH